AEGRAARCEGSRGAVAGHARQAPWLRPPDHDATGSRRPSRLLARRVGKAGVEHGGWTAPPPIPWSGGASLFGLTLHGPGEGMSTMVIRDVHGPMIRAK